jgi:hypothetical protein
LCEQGLKTLIYIYVAGYALVVVWGVVDGFKEREPWWDIASDLILLPLGFIGMLLYLFDVDDTSWVRSMWKGVTVAIIVGQLITNLLHRRRVLSGKTELKPEQISQWTILAADLTAIVLLGPMVALNVIYAFVPAR